MPFFEQKDDINRKVDYNHSQPVSVIACFNPEGKIMPVYVSLEDLYGNICKTKIEAINYTKDGHGYTTYCCVYSNGYRKRQMNLTFFIEKHLWVLENY